MFDPLWLLLIFFALVVVTVPTACVYVGAPELLPGARGKAARQLAAIEAWRNGLGRRFDWIYARAKGYFAARDWCGVGAAYLEARRIVDGDE